MGRAVEVYRVRGEAEMTKRRGLKPRPHSLIMVHRQTLATSSLTLPDAASPDCLIKIYDYTTVTCSSLTRHGVL